MCGDPSFEPSSRGRPAFGGGGPSRAATPGGRAPRLRRLARAARGTTLVAGVALALWGCEPSEPIDFSFQAQETTNLDFGTPVTYGTAEGVGNLPSNLAVGDFNNDTFPDVVIANRLEDATDPNLPADPEQPGTLTVLLNNGDGTLTVSAALSLADAGIRPTKVLAADLNNDGYDDLGFLYKDNALLRVLINDGAGTGWTATDLDLDGPESPTEPPVAYQFEFLDLNGDSPNAPDIVVSLNDESAPDYVQGIVAYLNDGSGGFPALGLNTPLWQANANTVDDEPGVGNHPSRFVVGDLNGDTTPDLAVLNIGADRVNIFLGNGDGTFNVTKPSDGVTANTVGTGDGPDELVIFQFNEDGFPDLAITNRISGTVTLLEGAGDGTFSGASESPVNLSGDNNRPEKIVTGAFTAAGADLAVVDRRSRRLGFINGDGFGSLSEETLDVGFDPFDLLVVDIDGDGNLDLLVMERDNRVVAVLAGDGAGGFTRTVVGLEHLNRSPALADLDSDGTCDLLLVQPDADQLVVLFNQNAGPVPCP